MLHNRMHDDLKYFPNAGGAEELKERYKELARDLHPDKSGLSGAEFAEMHREYLRVCDEPPPPDTDSSVTTEIAVDILDFFDVMSRCSPVAAGLSAIAKHVLKDRVQEKVLTIRPNMTDLLEPTAIQVERGGEVFVVPAWHQCLVFDRDIVVVAEPELPRGVRIDPSGNLHVSLLIADEDVVCGFLGDGETVAAGTTLVLRNKGVPVGNSADIFDVSKRMHVLIHA